MRPNEIRTALWLFAVHGAWAFTLSLYDQHYPGGISVLSLAFFYGIWRGSALAWQWSRFVLYASIVTVLLIVSLTIVTTVTEPQWDLYRRMICFTANSLVGFYALWSLNRPASLAYFDLVCPSCGTQPARADSFLYTQKSCVTCGARW